MPEVSPQACCKSRLRADSKTLIEDKQSDYGYTVMGMEIRPDHVHLLLDANPQLGVVSRLSARSKAIRLPRPSCTEYPWLKKRLPSLWTRSKFICYGWRRQPWTWCRRTSRTKRACRWLARPLPSNSTAPSGRQHLHRRIDVAGEVYNHCVLLQEHRATTADLAASSLFLSLTATYRAESQKDNADLPIGNGIR